MIATEIEACARLSCPGSRRTLAEWRLLAESGPSPRTAANDPERICSFRQKMQGVICAWAPPSDCVISCAPRSCEQARTNLDERDDLLGMVAELDRALDRNLFQSPCSAQVTLEILSTCKRMRLAKPSGAVKYWLKAIERHARAIAKSAQSKGAEVEAVGSRRYLGSRLLEDIFNLRLQLMKESRSALGTASGPEPARPCEHTPLAREKRPL